MVASFPFNSTLLEFSITTEGITEKASQSNRTVSSHELKSAPIKVVFLKYTNAFAILQFRKGCFLSFFSMLNLFTFSELPSMGPN